MSRLYKDLYNISIASFPAPFVHSFFHFTNVYWAAAICTILGARGTTMNNIGKQYPPLRSLLSVWRRQKQVKCMVLKVKEKIKWGRGILSVRIAVVEIWWWTEQVSQAGAFGIRTWRPGRCVVEQLCKLSPITNVSSSADLCISQLTLPTKPHISAFPLLFRLPTVPSLKAQQISEILSLHS